MKRSPDHSPIQKLALRNTAPVLTAAAACRSAATLAHQHHGKVPDTAIAETVASYAAILRAAVGSLGKRPQHPPTTDEDEIC